MPTGSLLYIELTPADIAAGSITISSSVPDGIGNTCDETLTINFADFPQASNPFCSLTCFAGGINTDLLDNGIIVCEGETFTLSTNGLEDLTLPCNSDDGSSYVYGWRVLVDLYNTSDYAAVTSWQPFGSNPTINPATFFIDEFGYMPPYFTPGYPISVEAPYYYGPWNIRIQGAALCLNADGTINDACVANNQGYEINQVQVTYLPADDPTCLSIPPSNDECINAIDISSAFTRNCEITGPFDHTGATIADVEPPLPNCFLDGYNGTSWYSFTVPFGISGEYTISTGVFEGCGTSNPLGGGNPDTQIAIYDGTSGCPGATSTPLDCNEDFVLSNNVLLVSSVSITLTPGNTYYIMVETFNDLNGEFCFYVSPNPQSDCLNCSDNICTEVFGEDFSTCPADCPCVGDFFFINIDPVYGFPVLVQNYVALCPEIVGATEDGLYIPYTLSLDNVPVGVDGVTYESSVLTSSVGTIFGHWIGVVMFYIVLNGLTATVAAIYI